MPCRCSYTGATYTFTRLKGERTVNLMKKFNLLDIAIGIFTLALCFGGIIYLIKSATADIKTVLITVTVSDDTAENIALQDDVFLQNGEKLGVITAVLTLGSNVRTEKVLEITFETEDGKVLFKTGQTLKFRTHRVLAEGVIYSIKIKDAQK